jgi:pSer/pThr/pTyr-binding forkhead associated (FHA) protein
MGEDRAREGSAVRARLRLPDNREIPLAIRAQWMGRDDFNGIVSEESAKYISQRHLIIRFENGLYYVEDQDSTNGTRLNGTEIRGKGKFELNNGDLIEVAEVITLIFKVD